MVLLLLCQDTKPHASPAIADKAGGGQSNNKPAGQQAVESAPQGAEQEAAAAAAEDVQLEYLGAPAPVCELNRIKHLHDLKVLYTPPEQRFDDITRLCTLVFKVRGHVWDLPLGGGCCTEATWESPTGERNAAQANVCFVTLQRQSRVQGSLL
jgi:hypothetical protein